MRDGIPTTVITESMAGPLMRQGGIDFVVVGADRIAANGDVANKIGTYTVAMMARAHGVPFYVAAPALDHRPCHARWRPHSDRTAQRARDHALRRHPADA